MRWLVLLVVVFSTLEAVAQTSDVVLEAHIAGQVEQLDLTASPEDYSEAGPVRWRGLVSRLGSGFNRLHVVADFDTLPAGTEIEFDAGGDQVETMLVTDIGSEGEWSGLLPSGDIVVSLRSPEKPQDLVLVFDQVMFETDLGTLSSTWGGVDETKLINDPTVPEALRALGGPIARLSFFRGGKPRDCTGFLVADNTLVTNEHCVADAESCDTLRALFGYERDSRNRLQLGKQFRCKSVDTLRSNFELDVALLELDASPGEAFGVVTLSDEDPDAGAPLALIQHPGGLDKRISFIECGVLTTPVDGRATGSDLAHSCDTAEGASGAPLLSLEGDFVGLHHYGFETNTVEGWNDNRAVLGSKVRDWIKAELEGTAAPQESVAEPDCVEGGAATE